MSFLAKRKIHIFNGFLLILPLLAWNVIFTPRLTQEGFTSDANVPAWILVAETLLRIVVFVFPLFLPLNLKDGRQRIGFAVYLIGMILYVGSWIPFLISPDFAWCSTTVGILAPYLTPLIIFVGIGMIGGSTLYIIIATAFTVFHTMHGIISFRLLS
ncbi:MAG: hypothetical protein U9R58_05055 [Chloroflexota bacterium]|nr:hypothetical protein [Chloroflexota bacterium]